MSDVSEYTETDDSDHEKAKQIIARTLQMNAQGRDNAISSKELAHRTPVSASTVRDLVPEVRREYRLPIGSSNGYFIIENADEFGRQVERQLNQAERSRQTAQEIAAAWNTWKSQTATPDN